MSYENVSSQDCKALQKVVRLAERISGSALPSLKDIYLKRCIRRAAKIIKDTNRLFILLTNCLLIGNRLFILLPSGKHFPSMMAKTERLKVRSQQTRMMRVIHAKLDAWTFWVYSLHSREKLASFAREIRAIRTWNSLHNRCKYTSWEGLLPGSSSLVAKCIPVFVKVRRCICSSR